MALGALIAAYQEDDSGGLRGLLPLAGRTLLEYQARCAAAAGASPIVVLVERIPVALNEAIERLRHEGVGVVPVSDGNEAASRFEPGEMVLLIGDGVAPPVELVSELAESQEPVVVTIPDEEHNQRFERIDAASRWAGVALVEGRAVGATAAMLGDWDLQSTLLRKTLQAGAVHVPVTSENGRPMLAERAEELSHFERQLIAASRSGRTDVASRYLLPIAEDFATERLMETKVRPQWLVYLALALSLAAAGAFLKGWPIVASALLLLSTPLDLVARRLAVLRLRPLGQSMLSRRLLWPAAGLALLALGWWDMTQGAGWGAVFAAVSAAAFAQAARVERAGIDLPGELWLFSRRNAIILALPFAVGGAWTALTVVLCVYAAVSFFYAQHVQHHIHRN